MLYKNFRISFIYLSFLLLTFANVKAENYSLFNPVPKEKMRPMGSERPTKADSSHTIDSGHLQIETSFYSHNKNKDKDSKTTSSSFFNSTAFRLGITQNIEIQAIISPITWQKNKDYSDYSTQHNVGFGDSILRFKYNFIGNDSGLFSIAAIPFVKIPTNSGNLSNNSTESGISVPLDFDLGNGFGFSYTVQGLHLKRSDINKYKTVFANMFVIGKSFNPKLSGYVEYYAEQIAEDNDHKKKTLDFSAVYALTNNIMIDSAVNFGLSNRSNDLEILIGGSFLF